jgi:plastocyanin
MVSSRFVRPPLKAVLVVVVVGALVGACGSSTAPTPAGAASPSPAESVDAPVPTAIPDPGLTQPAAGGGPVVTAANIAFEPTDLAAPAGEPFKLTLVNKDAGVPHTIAITGPDGSELFVGEIFTGPGARTFDVPALAAGSYAFLCKVHPNMTGTLHVGG